MRDYDTTLAELGSNQSACSVILGVFVLGIFNVHIIRAMLLFFFFTSPVDSHPAKFWTCEDLAFVGSIYRAARFSV